MKKQVKQTSPIGLTYPVKYGTYTIESFSRDSVYRYDRYTSADAPDLTGGIADIFVTGRRDSSPIYGGKYEGKKCSCCYLNFAHSDDYHAANVAAWDAQHPAAKAEAERHAAWVACYL